MKKTISLITMLLTLAFQAATAQTVSVDDVNVKQGSENTLDVHLKNADNSVASGFTLVLPDGALDGYSIVLGKDVINDHVVFSEQLSSNELKVAIYSITNSTFKNGNNGDVLLTVKFLGAGCKSGNYKGYLRGGELASTTKQLIRLSDVTFNINVEGNGGSCIKGDVDGDGTVSVTDVAMIVNHILGVGDDNFIAANADINGDGVIDINDVMGTVGIILGDDKPQAYLTFPDNHHPLLINL